MSHPKILVSSVKQKRVETEVNPEKTSQELELEANFRPETKRKAREEINSLMDEYLAKGGKIKKHDNKFIYPEAKDLRSVSKFFKPKGKKSVQK